MNWLSIDFGTSQCSAAILSEKGIPSKVNMSAIGSSQYDFPTIAYLCDNGEIKVGYEAEEGLTENPSNYIFGFKCDVNFSRVDDNIPQLNNRITYTQVISAILKKIKRAAETQTGGNPINYVVITIPIIYEDNAIVLQKFRNAAKNSGFTKVEFIAEPKAAAIYFNHILSKHFPNQNLTAFIYDLGGGTFDPSIISIGNSETGIDNYELIGGTEGIKIGGITFDRLIFRDFMDHIRQSNITVENRASFLNRNYKRCRDDIKHRLSAADLRDGDAVSIVVPINNREVKYSLSLSKLNEKIQPNINETLASSDNLLKSNNKGWNDIDVLLFVGGSCNIPLVRRSVTAHVKKTNPKCEFIWNLFKNVESTEPQYAVSLGAALYINHLSKTKMNPTIYTEKRDILIKIIDKILKIKQLGADKRVEFKSISKKCLENQFNIVLVGEFQGGKSTTFNAFCDGREISPRGAMVKTSACRITARNLSDRNTAEYAEVIWKTERELILNIEDILSRHISIEEDLGINYKPGDERKPLSELLSFSNRNHFGMMNNAISKEWDNYEKHKAAYSHESLDILRIATIILRFANIEETKKLIGEKTIVTIYDISNIVVFPKAWEEKWSAGINVRHSFAEVKFAFVASVDCYIHSPNLSRLGCTITDCPGLFASKWDTQVAIDTIPKADAILYLLNGSRAIGVGDVASLREIQSMPAAHKKIFFSINIKNSRPIIDNAIIPADVATINNIGFNIKDQNIHRYHALLAFLAEFGQKHIDNKLDKTSKNIFLALSKQFFNYDYSVEESWIMQSNQHLLLTCVPPQTISSIAQESVNKVSSISGFNELFDGIEEFIVRNKAESILITNGAEKCSLALTNIENTLKNRELEATENVAQRELELELARQKLIEFQTEANTIVADSFKENIFDQLKNDYYEDVLMGSSEEICRIITPKLEKKLTPRLGLKMIMMSDNNRQEMLKTILSPIYQDALSEVLFKRTKVWLNSVIKGENEAYKNSVSHEICRINTEINAKWEQVQALPFKFPQIELPAPNELNKIVMQNDKVKSPVLESDILGSLYKIARSNLILEIIAYIILSPAVILAWLYEIAESIVNRLRNKPESSQQNPVEKIINSYDDLDADQKKIYDKMLPQLKSAFGDRNTTINLKRCIWEGLLSKIATGLKALYKSNLSEQEKTFTKDYNDTVRNLNKSTEERRRIAEEANKLRTEQIEPCNREIKVFMESTIKTIQGNGSK